MFLHTAKLAEGLHASYTVPAIFYNHKTFVSVSQALSVSQK